MPTLDTPIGKTLEIGIKTEAIYGVAPVGPLARTPVYSISLSPAKPLENDPILGAAQFNGVDATAPAPALLTSGGQVEAPLDLNHIGHWLHMFFGDAAVTEDSGVYEHAFTSGRLVLPSAVLQEKLGARVVQDVGVAGRTMRFQMGQAAGFRRVTLELGARDQIVPVGGALALTAGLPDARVAATKGQLLYDGTAVATLLSLDATYDTKLEEERYVDGSDAVSGWARGDQEASWTGTMTVRWKPDSPFDAIARNETAAPLTLRYANGADLSLDMVSTVRLARTGLPVTGPGKLQQAFQFRGQQTASLPMLTATLVNAVAAYS